MFYEYYSCLMNNGQWVLLSMSNDDQWVLLVYYEQCSVSTTLSG